MCGIMTTIDDILEDVDQDRSFMEKWTDIATEIGNHVTSSRFNRSYMKKLSFDDMYMLCKRYMMDCNRQVENALNAKCIVGLGDYIENDIRDPHTGMIDRENQLRIESTAYDCAITAGKRLFRKKSKFNAWKSQSEQVHSLLD